MENKKSEKKRLIDNFHSIQDRPIPISFWMMEEQDMLPEHRGERSDFYRSEVYYSINFYKPISRYLKF